MGNTPGLGSKGRNLFKAAQASLKRQSTKLDAALDKLENKQFFIPIKESYKAIGSFYDSVEKGATKKPSSKMG